MTSQERVKTAMKRGIPDRVPYWCLLSLEHIVKNSALDGNLPDRVEQFLQAECELTRRYDFDGHLIYFPFLTPEFEIKPFLEKMIYGTPKGKNEGDFGETDPDLWEPELPVYRETERYSCQLSRQILGDDTHLGSWVADGYSRAVQWFPSLEEAGMAMLTDPSRFRALVQYFDRISMAEAEAQILHAGIQSIQISSPYAGSKFISREHYREMVLPSVSKLADKIHSLNAFSYIHTCGHISDRLDLMAASGADGIECMDPPPLGDVTLSDAIKRVGNRLFLKGNIDSVNILLLGNDELFEKTVKETVEAGSIHGGFILSTACSVAPDVKPERLVRMREIADSITSG